MCCTIDLRQADRLDATLYLVYEGQRGAKKNDEVDRSRFCFDLRFIGTGYATRAPPAAGRKGHYCPRSMWGRNAHGEWYLRENSRPPRRQ